MTFKMAIRTSSVTSIMPTELLPLGSWHVLSFNLAKFAVFFLCALAVFVKGKEAFSLHRLR